MFNMQHTGKIISSARKAQNMTQLELADQLGISFQAVSNWERGISMPDIAKLPEVAQLLQISIDDLLNETSPLINGLLKEGDTYLEEASIAQEDLIEAAPLLKPDQFKAAYEKLDPPIDISDDPTSLSPLFPFLEEELIDELTLKTYEQQGISALNPLFAFCSSEILERIALQEFEKTGLKNIAPLAPFLEQEVCDSLVQKSAKQHGISSIASLAPFISDAIINELAQTSYETDGVSSITHIVPFLSQKTIDGIATEALLKEGISGIQPILPFISPDLIKKIVTGSKRNTEE